MTHLEKMSRFASQADSFINAALDQLDDAVEQVVVTGGAAEADPEVAKHVLDPAALRDVRLATTFWGDLDLARRREEWRDAAVAITDSRERAEASKRALADAARAAKAAEKEETSSPPSPPSPLAAARDALVKALADEVKALGSRCHFAETAFLSALNDLDEAPDPAGPLRDASSAAQFVAASHADAENARTALAAARADLAASVASARSNAAKAAELETLTRDVETRVAQEADRRAAEAERRAEAAEAAQRAAANARAVAEEQLRAARRAHDDAQSRVFELEERRSADAELAAEADPARIEAEELRAELARTRAALRAAERREAEARARRERDDEDADEDRRRSGREVERGAGNTRAGAAESAARGTPPPLSALSELESARASVEALSEQLRRAREECAACRDEANEAAARGAAERAARAEETNALRAKIATLAALVDAEDAEFAENGAYDVTALHASGTTVAEATGAEATVAEATEAPSASADAAPLSSAPLAAVRARNKRLASDLAAATRALSEATRALASAELARDEALASAAAVRVDTNAAVAELERHLVATTALAPAGEDARGGAEVSVSGGFPGSSAGAGSSSRDEKNENARDAATLLPVVVGQRDRHKRRVVELETRASRLEADLEAERAKAASLAADNLGLFEKVKYLQSYYAERTSTSPPMGPPGSGAAASPLDALAARRAARVGCFPAVGRGFRRGVYGGASLDGGSLAETVPGGDADGLLARHEPLYASALDPFAAFRAREAEAAGRRLSAYERIAVGSAKALMRGRAHRLAVVAYVLLVHVVAAAALARCATASPIHQA
jgi:homeobox protein cut-like